MKSRNYLNKIGCGVAIVCLLAAFSCKKSEGYNNVISNDMTKPNPVTNVKVSNFNGGAYITYALPNSQNILYVQAEYKINDIKVKQSKSSYYSDSITVNGFAKSQDYSVVLRVVSRANVLSDSVVVTVHPDTPSYLLAYKALLAQNTFGGVNIQTTNRTGAPIGVVSMLPSAATGKYEIVDQNYSNSQAINYSLRGYDTMPKQFGFYVTDPDGNRSDTLFKTINPVFEQLMNKSLFQQYVLATDVKSYQNGVFNLPNLWDNNYGEPCYNTEQPLTTVTVAKPYIWPAWMTFDMGQTAKLSRYMLWFRVGGDNKEFVWTSGAPQTWILWGRADTPQDELMPSDTTKLPPVGSMTPGGWINLGLYNAPPRPPHSPLTNADYTIWTNGFNFDVPFNVPKVRYLRFECLQIMGGTNNYFNLNEMSVYGNTKF